MSQLTDEEKSRAEAVIAREKVAIDFASSTLSDEEAVLVARYLNNLSETDAAELVDFARGRISGDAVGLPEDPSKGRA